MIKISAVIPVYNEALTVFSTIEEIKDIMKESGYEYEIIAVNDGSTDGSREILDGIKEIKTIHHEYNRGYGRALKTGIKNATGEYVLIMDADGTYPANEIPKLLEYMSKYDMVVGARIGKGVHIPLMRRPAKIILKMLAEILTNKSIPDVNCGLRIFRRKTALKFWNLFPERFSFTITSTLAYLTNGYAVKYVPINYLKRKGASTIHPIKDFINFVGIMIRMMVYFEPLRIFVPMSFFLFLLGVLRGIRDVIIVNTFGQLTVIIFLTSLQIAFFGLLADLIIKRSRSEVI